MIRIRNASTPTEAALIFAAYFEGCLKYYQDEEGKVHYYDIQGREKRVNAAIDIYDEMTRWK